MREKLVVDSDIILDLLAIREPFYDFAVKLFLLGYTKQKDLFTTSIVLANVFYILRKILGIEIAKEKIRNLRLILNVLSVDTNIVDAALQSDFSDFEDAMQYFCAKTNNISIIITRNTKDYKVKDMLVQTAEEYLKISDISCTPGDG
jgi:predicted nucleic acid-binding protein